MDGTSVQVATRIRPLSRKETEELCSECCEQLSREELVMKGKDRRFTFDHVFGPRSQQQDIYEGCVSELVENLMSGYNATVLAYGQTGSGKTYTMGSSSDCLTGTEASMGIIPRAMAHIFELIAEKKAVCPQAEFYLRVQFLELYGEEIRDLLAVPTSADKKATPVTLRESEKEGDMGVKVHGANECTVTCTDDMIEMLEQGTMLRTTASTEMNLHSSRSHAIFTIVLEQELPSDMTDDPSQNGEADSIKEASTSPPAGEATTGEGAEVVLATSSLSSAGNKNKEYRTAKFHFVDLAGSERAKRTGATGMRLREGININKGLLALGNVISALGDESKRNQRNLHVPYRDSKLTRMLQDSLGGNSRTLMITCVSPADINFEETLNALRYANRARNIKNKPVVNRDAASSQVAFLKEQVAKLRMQLMNGGLIPQDLDRLGIHGGAIGDIHPPPHVATDLDLENELAHAREQAINSDLEVQRLMAALDKEKRARSDLQEKHVLAVTELEFFRNGPGGINAEDGEGGEGVEEGSAQNMSKEDFMRNSAPYIRKVQELEDQLNQSDAELTKTRRQLERHLNNNTTAVSSITALDGRRRSVAGQPQRSGSNSSLLNRQYGSGAAVNFNGGGAGMGIFRHGASYEDGNHSFKEEDEENTNDDDDLEASGRRDSDLGDAFVNEILEAIDAEGEDEKITDEDDEQTRALKEKFQHNQEILRTSVRRYDVELNNKLMLIERVKQDRQKFELMKDQFEKKMAEMNAEVEDTHAQKYQLETRLKTLEAQSVTDASKKEANKLRGQLKLKTDRLRELELKSKELDLVKRTLDKKRRLEQDIQREIENIKKQKVDYQRRMEESAKRYREESKVRKLEILQLRKHSRKTESEKTKIVAKSQRTASMLKVKTEQLAALQRRVREGQRYGTSGRGRGGRGGGRGSNNAASEAKRIETERKHRLLVEKWTQDKIATDEEVAKLHRAVRQKHLAVERAQRLMKQLNTAKKEAELRATTAEQQLEEVAASKSKAEALASASASANDGHAGVLSARKKDENSPDGESRRRSGARVESVQLQELWSGRGNDDMNENGNAKAGGGCEEEGESDEDDDDDGGEDPTISIADLESALEAAESEIQFQDQQSKDASRNLSKITPASAAKAKAATTAAAAAARESGAAVGQEGDTIAVVPTESEGGREGEQERNSDRKVGSNLVTTAAMIELMTASSDSNGEGDDDNHYDDDDFPIRFETKDEAVSGFRQVITMYSDLRRDHKILETQLQEAQAAAAAAATSSSRRSNSRRNTMLSASFTASSTRAGSDASTKNIGSGAGTISPAATSMRARYSTGGVGAGGGGGGGEGGSPLGGGMGAVAESGGVGGGERLREYHELVQGLMQENNKLREYLQSKPGMPVEEVNDVLAGCHVQALEDKIRQMQALGTASGLNLSASSPHAHARLPSFHSFHNNNQQPQHPQYARHISNGELMSSPTRHSSSSSMRMRAEMSSTATSATAPCSPTASSSRFGEADSGIESNVCTSSIFPSPDNRPPWNSSRDLTRALNGAADDDNNINTGNNSTSNPVQQAFASAMQATGVSATEGSVSSSASANGNPPETNKQRESPDSTTTSPSKSPTKRDRRDKGHSTNTESHVGVESSRRHAMPIKSTTTSTTAGAMSNAYSGAGSGGDSSSGGGARDGKVFDRLNDPKNFTGTHKHRAFEHKLITREECVDGGIIKKINPRSHHPKVATHSADARGEDHWPIRASVGPPSSTTNVTPSTSTSNGALNVGNKRYKQDEPGLYRMTPRSRSGSANNSNTKDSMKEREQSEHQTGSTRIVAALDLSSSISPSSWQDVMHDEDVVDGEVCKVDEVGKENKLRRSRSREEERVTGRGEEEEEEHTGEENGDVNEVPVAAVNVFDRLYQDGKDKTAPSIKDHMAEERRKRKAAAKGKR